MLKYIGDFLAVGIRNKEFCACLYEDPIEESAIAKAVESAGLNEGMWSEAIEAGNVVCLKLPAAVYRETGILTKVSALFRLCRDAPQSESGLRVCRVVGALSYPFEPRHTERISTYETVSEIWLRVMPVHALCCYPVTGVDIKQILKIAEAHPRVVICESGMVHTIKDEKMFSSIGVKALIASSTAPVSLDQLGVSSIEQLEGELRPPFPEEQHDLLSNAALLTILSSLCDGAMVFWVVPDDNGIVSRVVYAPVGDSQAGSISMQLVGKRLSTLLVEASSGYLNGLPCIFRDVVWSPNSPAGLLFLLYSTPSPTLHHSLLDAIILSLTCGNFYSRFQVAMFGLLLDIFPVHVVKLLLNSHVGPTRHVITENYNSVAVCFIDICKFSEFSRTCSSGDVVNILNSLFSSWDLLCNKNGCWKLKTMGDCYIVASGLPAKVDHPTASITRFAFSAMESCKSMWKCVRDFPIQVKVGIHFGPVVAGIIGSMRTSYDIWGETVNVAQRVQESSTPDRVTITEAALSDLCSSFPESEDTGPVRPTSPDGVSAARPCCGTKGDYRWESRGTLNLKGQAPVDCFFLEKT
ncbi:response regulator [Pelomyxa schiedti]|nr:response regulator [Pelomyxa schiedti]